MNARLKDFWRRLSADSWLAAAFLERHRSLRRCALLIVVGAGLEVTVMAVLGMLGAGRVLGLPGPLAVGIAAAAGIFAGPYAAAIVSLAGVAAYVGFLSR